MAAKEQDRIRESTSGTSNSEIDAAIEQSIAKHKGKSAAKINQRIAELDAEWDIERVLTLNASTLTLLGLALGVTKDRRWLALPTMVMAFLFQHSVQGWCPPLPVFRKMGIRTRGEIDREKYGLKDLLAK
jgi:hypothetical protein